MAGSGGSDAGSCSSAELLPLDPSTLGTCERDGALCGQGSGASEDRYEPWIRCARDGWRTTTAEQYVVQDGKLANVYRVREERPAGGDDGRRYRRLRRWCWTRWAVGICRM